MSVVLLTRGDGMTTCFSPFRCARMWPFTVASERGGNFLNCLTVKVGNVVRYPAETAFANVSSVGENKDAW